MVAVAGMALLGTLLVAPRAVGAHGLPVVAHLVALRGPVAVGAAATGAVLALAAVLLRGRSSTRAAVLRRLAAVTATGLLLVAGANAAVLLGRAGAGVAPADGGDLPDGAVVVLVSNTQGGIGPAELAELLVERRADVAVLPETWGATAREAAELAADDGLDLEVLARDGEGGRWVSAATALLVSRALGDYEVVDELDTLRSSFTAAPRTGDGPAITAVHPVAPVPGWMGLWPVETADVVEACPAAPGGITAGDLNATVDHPGFDSLVDTWGRPVARPGGGCVDAAQEVGAGAAGTWPAGLPRVLGAQIDHVLVDPTRWTVLRVTVLDPPSGTDHRVVEAVLLPREG